MSWFVLSECEEERQRTKKPRVFRDRLNPIEELNDSECVQRYRVDRNGILDLCQLLKNALVRPTSRVHAIPVVVQVCAALRFFTLGAFYRVTGDTMGISTSSLCRIVHSVARALVARVGEFIKFPENEASIARTKQQFYAIKQFPSVLGAIDCTLVEIISPKSEIEADYVNRKGRHSINVQAVANATLEFTNVVAKFPGRVHDSFIWSSCGLKRIMEERSSGWLLGDAGYPLEPNLMTPFGNPSTPSQQRYNVAHAKTRNVVERAFGVLKMRFRCLDTTAGKLMFAPERACRVIIACFILHNIARRKNFYGEDIDSIRAFGEELHEFNVEITSEFDANARNLRANLLLNNFNI